MGYYEVDSSEASEVVNDGRIYKHYEVNDDDNDYDYVAPDSL